MRDPHGYAVIVDPGAKRMVEERDTFSCCHCHRVVHVKPLTDPVAMGGYCPNCDDGHGRGYHCNREQCFTCNGGYFKQLEKEEAQAQRDASMIVELTQAGDMKKLDAALRTGRL